MAKNNFAPDDTGAEGREQSAQHHLHVGCEPLVHIMATDPRMSTVLRIIPSLCPGCSQKFTELLTTVGIGTTPLSGPVIEQ